MEVKEEKSKLELSSQARYDLADLIRITALLRAPDGCPWDKEQTHKSVRKCVIEEAYEVAEAIDCESDTMLREELGDLLFQAAFHAQLAAERGAFDFHDVVNDVAKKMVERHPHVFGEVKAEDTASALQTWDAQKRKEKKQKDTADAMNAVAKTLPSLMRAQKLIRKAKDTPCAVCGDASYDTPEKIADALFCLCASANDLGVDCEQLLFEKNEAYLHNATHILEKQEKNEKK
jgi:tetrapyrrole methylase family protein/MazG family protein